MGALHRLFAGGFVASLLRMLLEVADFGTDSLALHDVLSNEQLKAFHVSYTMVYTLATLVTLYIFTFRGKEVWRKYQSASVAPAAFSDAASSASVALAMIKESVAEVLAYVTDLEASTAAEALEGELVDSVKIKAAEQTQRDLAKDADEVEHSMDESK